jgi:hypothetical protein
MLQTRIRLVRETEEASEQPPPGEAEIVADDRGLAGRLLAWLPNLTAGRGRTRHMKVIEMLPMGGRRQLTLVSCDGERFLVGSGADGVASIVRVHTGPDMTLGSESTAKGLAEPWV